MTVGDWVAVCDAAGDRAAIEAVLPRRTKFSRKTPWLKAEEHVLVANVDTVLLVTGLDHDFNPRRLERYLVAGWDSGADPVVVLTKLDVCDDVRKLDEAEAVAVGVPVLAVSSLTGQGVDDVRALLRPADRSRLRPAPRSPLLRAVVYPWSPPREVRKATKCSRAIRRRE